MFADHTYLQDGLTLEPAKHGTWSFSGFPDRGHVILKGYIHGVDTHVDGIFTLDPIRKKLDGTRGYWEFQKVSDETELKLTDMERKVLGIWSGQANNDSNPKQWLTLLSDHQFMIEYESVGKWHVSGQDLILEWSHEETHRTQKSKLRIDLVHGRLTFNPEGYSLSRPKPES